MKKRWRFMRRRQSRSSPADGYPGRQRGSNRSRHRDEHGKADYITAQTNTTKAVNSVNSTLTALRISLQRALDTKNSVLTIDDSVAKALSDASDAIALLNTLEGVSEIIKTAAAEAFSRAQEAAVEVNAYVEAANTKYNEAAELVKDYVVIEEKPADDTPTDPTPTTPDPVPGETESNEYVYTKYANDNGNIVMVTYGDGTTPATILRTRHSSSTTTSST